MSTATLHHRVTDLHFNADALIITVDGKNLNLPLAKLSPRLLAATPQERQIFEISTSGYGINWPQIDEDLSLDGILRLAGSL